MKVLLVDDSTINNIMMENLLSSYGFDTHSILESASVIRAINEYNPDLILLDLMMPGLSGFDILKKMNEEKITIPTIVITAYHDQGYAKKAKALGAKHYITKPFNHEDLIIKIKETISQK